MTDRPSTLDNLTPKNLTEEQRELAGQQLKIFWRGTPPKIIEYGVKFGLIRIGWTLRDYMAYAVETTGYETICTWAERGSGKSNRLLIHGGWMHCQDKYDYDGWKIVLERTKFKPKDFISMLRGIPHGKRYPWVGIDDIGVHMPSTIWRTDIETYQAVDAVWAAIRTKVNVIDVNIPLIDRLAKNIKDSLSFEMFMGKNQNILIERLVRLPNIRDQLEANFRKCQIEPIHKIDLYEVPTDVFKEYWEMRLTLADEALERLDNIFSKRELEDGIVENPDNWTPSLDVAMELCLSPITISTLVRDKSIRTKIIKGRLHVFNEDISKLEAYYAKKRIKKAKKRERKD